MLSDEIRSYIAEREAGKLEKHDKDTESGSGKLSEAEKPAFLADQQAKREKIRQLHTPDEWLTDAAKRASQIQLATHAPKYTHSDAKASSINAAGISGRTDRIGTHSTTSLSIDVTGNAAALDVANLLLLSHEGEVLWEHIGTHNTKSLQPFAQDDEQLSLWMQGFRVAVTGSDFFTHALSKQTYFPVGDGTYHLLAPLFSSSLSHEMCSVVQSSRFGENAKAARAARRVAKPDANPVVNYTDTAEMTFGGSKPQNISLLNSQRRGTAYLLSCAPPTWQQRARLPVRGRAAFWRTYRWRVRNQVRTLNRFLDKVEHYNNTNIREARKSMVTGLIDEWLTLVASIRELGSPGWSAGCELTLQEQCLLDPKRRDDDNSSVFNQMLETDEWKARIADDFAQWLNQALSSRKRNLADAEAGIWSGELKNAFAVLRNDLDQYL